MPEDDYRSEFLTDKEPMPIPPTAGIKVYDRPTGLRAVPVWVFILLALLILVGLWAFFSTLA